VRALARLRVATRDETGQIRDLDEALTEALVKLGEWPDETERNALAMKLFDSEGVRLVQLAEQGEKGIAKLRKRFQELGGALSEEGARRAVEANDAWTDLTVTLNGFIFSMGTERLTTAVLGVVVVWKTWAVFIALVNTGLVLSIAKVAALIALFAVFVLIGQDIATFLSGAGDSVTGRAVARFGGVVTRIIDAMKAKLFAVLDLIPDKLFAIAMDTFDLIGRLWDRFIAIAKTAIESVIDKLIPPELMSLIRETGGLGTPTGRALLDRQRGTGITASAAALLGATAPLVGDRARARGPQIVNITVNQTAGETGLGVTRDIASGLLGEGVVAPLNGLAP
jgi:hypothetical protein